MRLMTFQAGGSLPGDSPVYIERDADGKAAAFLVGMNYITIIGPRQSGKTSLINHLIHNFSRSNFVFARRELNIPKSSKQSNDQWYQSLGSWILRQLSFLPRKKLPTPPIDAGSWEEFLAVIAVNAHSLNKRIVIALDEIGAIPQSIATDFFFGTTQYLLIKR